MKFKLILCAVSCLLSTIAKADLTQDAESIFNWAENTFPRYFPSHRTTQTLDYWRYRYYPETGIYVGANTMDNNVYGLGGEFGVVTKNVGSSQALLAMAGTNSSNGSISCVNLSLPAKGTRFFTDHSIKGQIGTAFGVVSKSETIYTAVTNTRLEQTVISTQLKTAFFPESISTKDSVTIFDVKDDIAYLSSNETSMTSDRLPDLIKTKTTYNPSIISGPRNKVCKNQTWQTTPSEQTAVSTVNGKETTKVSNVDPKHTFTVEAIDDEVATPAGSFKAIRIRNESDTEVLITWGSIDKGIPLKSVTTHKDSATVNESILTNVQYP
ncbi:MAG: hypothetical protein ABL903_04730 [Methylococcales bacterium]